MKAIYTLLIILIPFVGFGQGWIQYFNTSNQNLKSFEQTSDGGFILIGDTDSETNVENNARLVKTDEFGNEEWSKSIGDEDFLEFANSVQQTNDGGYVLTGTKNPSTDPYYAWLVKTDEFGNEEWSKTYNDVISGKGHSVKETNDGGFIIIGTTYSSTTTYLETWISKTDELGNEEWSKIFLEDNINKFGSGVTINENNFIDIASDGGFILITDISVLDGNIDFEEGVFRKIRLIKIDENGNEEWKKSFGNAPAGGESEGSYGHSVQQTNDGGYIILARTTIPYEQLTGIWLIKTDENGNEEWSEIYEYLNHHPCGGLTLDGGYIIGNVNPTINEVQGQGLLIKTDENGNEEWVKEIQMYDSSVICNQINSVQQTNDGGYIILGSFFDLENFEYMNALIKTDSQGNTTSIFEIPLPNSNRKLKKTIDILGKETKSQPNTPIIEIYDDGSTQKKLIIE